jgi:hypothetical protein
MGLIEAVMRYNLLKTAAAEAEEVLYAWWDNTWTCLRCGGNGPVIDANLPAPESGWKLAVHVPGCAAERLRRLLE